MKTKCLICLVVVMTAVMMPLLQAVTVIQSTGSSYAAFEADTVATIIARTPESWVSTNDVTASGGLFSAVAARANGARTLVRRKVG